MSGTEKGGKKAAETNLKRDKDFYKKIGALGGKKSRNGGFTDKELAARAGKVGGSVQRVKSNP